MQKRLKYYGKKLLKSAGKKKNLKQFLLKTNPDKNGLVLLEGNDYRYLVRVKRLAAGEFFPALLPNGEEAQMQIISVSGNTLTCKSCNESESANRVCVPSFSPVLPPIILFQALPKGDKMDMIVRQAAESGITEIVPFVSEFSVAKTKGDGQKFSRWERIIKEARQQSGSKIATSIHMPLTINLLINYWENLIKNETAGEKHAENPLGLLFHHIKIDFENANSVYSKFFKKVLDKNPLGFYHKASYIEYNLNEACSLHNYLDSNPSIISVTIGPEGGFSDSEVSLFLENDFKPITIGDTILRTETAALYCTAAVRTILLERDKWELNKQTAN